MLHDWDEGWKCSVGCAPPELGVVAGRFNANRVELSHEGEGEVYLSTHALGGVFVLMVFLITTDVDISRCCQEGNTTADYILEGMDLSMVDDSEWVYGCQ